MSDSLGTRLQPWVSHINDSPGRQKTHSPTGVTPTGTCTLKKKKKIVYSSPNSMEISFLLMNIISLKLTFENLDVHQGSSPLMSFFIPITTLFDNVLGGEIKC